MKSRNPLWNPEIRLKSRNPSRNPLWNPEIRFEIQKFAWNPEISREIHFEIQKSALKSRNPLWNPEIHFEIQKSRNPFWNPKSTWNPVDFEISYTETRRGGPLGCKRKGCSSLHGFDSGREEVGVCIRCSCVQPTGKEALHRFLTYHQYQRSCFFRSSTATV